MSKPPVGSSVQPTGAQIVSEVQKLGKAATGYLLGATGPAFYDCSSLVQVTLENLGIANVPRTSEEQYAWVQKISASQLQPGDLVFADFPGDGTSPGHVGIYIGNGQVYSAQDPALGIGVSTLSSWAGNIVGYGKIPGTTESGATGPGGASGNSGSGGGTPGAPSFDPLDFLSEANTLFRDLARSLNFGFMLFAPGQSMRIAMGAGAAVSGLGAVKLYTSPSASGEKNAAFPAAILLTGIAFLLAYMALRPWPIAQPSNKPYRPVPYAVDILKGETPAPGVVPDDSGTIQAGLEVLAGAWLLSKSVGGVSALANAGSGILGNVAGWAKGIFTGAEKDAGDLS